jgi:hypothetical protein
MFMLSVIAHHGRGTGQLNDIAAQARARVAQSQRELAGAVARTDAHQNRVTQVLDVAKIIAGELRRRGFRMDTTIESRTTEQKFRTSMFGAPRPDGWQTRTEQFGQGWRLHSEESRDNDTRGAALRGRYLVLAADGGVWYQDTDGKAAQLALTNPFEPARNPAEKDKAYTWMTRARPFILQHANAAFTRIVESQKIDPALLEPPPPAPEPPDPNLVVECLGRSFLVNTDHGEVRAAQTTARHAVGVPRADRVGQLEYVFMSWLRGRSERPDAYLGTPSMLPGGRIGREEVAALAQDLMNEGFARWIQVRVHLNPGRQAAMGQLPSNHPQRLSDAGPYETRWHFVLTDSGTTRIDEISMTFETAERTRLRRIALMRWIGEHRRSDQRTAPITSEDFLASPASVIEGVASTVHDAWGATSWLITAGFVTTDFVLTERGFICVDQYGCDPMETPLYSTPGPDQRVIINAPTGNVAIGSAHVVQSAGDIGIERTDIAGLQKYAEAIVAVLPVLALAPDQYRAVEAMAAEIRQLAEVPTPDHPRLRALGTTLRSILEGAATGALATGLSSLWTG